MQDQGKRLLLAVGLALLVMMTWQVLFPSKKPPPKPPTVGSGSQVVTPESSDPFYTPPATPTAGSGAGSGSSAEAPPVTPPAVALEGYGVHLELVARCEVRVPSLRCDHLVSSAAPDHERLAEARARGDHGHVPSGSPLS